jgi:hypothetical protein
MSGINPAGRRGAKDVRWGSQRLCCDLNWGTFPDANQILCLRKLQIFIGKGMMATQTLNTHSCNPCGSSVYAPVVLTG